jgi:hypothetical protein
MHAEDMSPAGDMKPCRSANVKIHASIFLQVRAAIESLKAGKAERSAEGKRHMPALVAGLMMGDVKTDFELTFGHTLNYIELGHKKLREVIELECNDFLKPPTDQYVMEVSSFLSNSSSDVLASVVSSSYCQS